MHPYSLSTKRASNLAAAEEPPNSERTDELHHQLVEQTTTKWVASSYSGAAACWRPLFSNQRGLPNAILIEDLLAYSWFRGFWSFTIHASYNLCPSWKNPFASQSNYWFNSLDVIELIVQVGFYKFLMGYHKVACFNLFEKQNKDCLACVFEVEWIFSYFNLGTTGYISQWLST